MDIYGIQPQDGVHLQAGLEGDADGGDGVDPSLQLPVDDQLGLDQQQLEQQEQQHQHAQLLLQQQQHHHHHQQQQLYVLPQENLHLHHDGLGHGQADLQQPQHHHLDYATTVHQLDDGTAQQRQHQQQQQQQQQRSATGRRAYKSRCKWPVDDKLVVVQTLVDQRALGHQAGGGFTLSAWNAVAEALAGSEHRSGGDVKGAEECRSAYSRLKREYVRVKQLKTQFPWDEVNQRPAVDEGTRRQFLRDHPAYTSVFGGWPYFDEMDLINGELPTVVASVNKPLQVAEHGEGGHKTSEGGGLDDGGGSQSDGSESLHHHHSMQSPGMYYLTGRRRASSSASELDPSRPHKRMRYGDSGFGTSAGAGSSSSAAAYVDPALEAFTFTPSAAAVAAAPPYIGGADNTPAATAAAAVSVFGGAELVGLTVEAEAAHAQVTAAAAALRDAGVSGASDARIAAKSLLWTDMLSEGWTLTDRDIVVVLQRFEEDYLYAETYAHAQSFSERLDYLAHILAGGQPYDPALDEVHDPSLVTAAHEGELEHELDPELHPELNPELDGQEVEHGVVEEVDPSAYDPEAVEADGVELAVDLGVDEGGYDLVDEGVAAP